MLKYTNVGDVTISVNLQNGYSVMAIAHWNNDIKKYQVSLYISGDRIDLWRTLDSERLIEFNSNKRTVKIDIAMYITDLLTNGFFKKYIDDYEYMLKCFDRSNSLYEEEGLV